MAMATPPQQTAAAAAQQKLPLLCYKTKMCKFFAVGRCNRGQFCTFAHHLADLQPVPDLTRTKVCPSLINDGFCGQDGCLFAHDAVELRMGPYGFGKALQQMATAAVETFRREPPAPAPRPPPKAEPEMIMNEALLIRLAAQTVPELDSPDKPKKNKKLPASVLHKTRLCIYHQAGHCYKKKDCNFAHSLKEMRDASMATQPRLAYEQLKNTRKQAPGPDIVPVPDQLLFEKSHSPDSETRSGSSGDSVTFEEPAHMTGSPGWPEFGSETSDGGDSNRDFGPRALMRNKIAAVSFSEQVGEDMRMSGTEFLPPLPVSEEVEPVTWQADLTLSMIPPTAVFSF